jgi:isopentenyl diphosphate isomerase/L-lactate dehydrogenase-like FMN-dependent dehydrogenase
MADLGQLIQTAKDRIPEKRSDRIKLMIAVPLLVICMIWLTYVVATSINWSGPIEAPDSPAHLLVNDLNGKLLENVHFNDVGFAIDSESPLKLRVVGVVHSPEHYAQLQKFLAEIRPENDYELDVVVLP